MSANWILIDADLSYYHSTKFRAGGRLYFLKTGRKNVSIYDLALRKNVSLKMSALPQFFYTPSMFTFATHFFPLKTWKSILKDFRGYTQKTKNEKDILDTLKTKIKLTK
tara:strand:- start:1743 stop:2069 length:327 start_codon:yes stop_codon:yes gene_type:complete